MNIEGLPNYPLMPEANDALDLKLKFWQDELGAVPAVKNGDPLRRVDSERGSYLFPLLGDDKEPIKYSPVESGLGFSVFWEGELSDDEIRHVEGISMAILRGYPGVHA